MKLCVVSCLDQVKKSHCPSLPLHKSSSRQDSVKMPLPSYPPADTQARSDLRAEEHEAKIWLAYYDQHQAPPPPGQVGHAPWKTLGDIADAMEIVGSGFNSHKIATGGIAKKGQEKWVNERKEKIKQTEGHHFPNVLRKEKIERELKGKGHGQEWDRQMARAQLGLGPYPGLGGDGVRWPGTYANADAPIPLHQQPQPLRQAYQQAQSQHTPQAYQQAHSQHSPQGHQQLHLDQAAPPPPLPEGWIHRSDQKGKIYYIHLATGHTQWEYPGDPTPLPRSQMAENSAQNTGAPQHAA